MHRERGRYGREMGSDRATPNVGVGKWGVRTGIRRYVQNSVGCGLICDCTVIAIQRRERRKADRRTGAAHRRGAILDGLRGPVACGIVGLVLFADWWNPVSWWNDFFGTVATTWDDVKNFIHNVVKSAVDLLADGVDFFYYVFTVITNALKATVDHLSAAADVLWSFMVSEAERVGGWITNAVDWLWSNIVVPALAVLQSAVDYVGSALGFAIDLVKNSLDDIWRNYIAPAFDWVEHAAETVGGWIGDAVSAFYNDVIKPVFDFVGQIGHDLYAALGYIYNDVVAVVNAVVKAWGWVIWFGEHSFEEILALLGGADHALTRDWLLGAAEHGSGVADEVAAWLEQILS